MARPVRVLGRTSVFWWSHRRENERWLDRFGEVGARPTQPIGQPAGVWGVMEAVTDIEDLFAAEFPRLVRALGVAYDAESAADAVQEAFIEADRRWKKVSTYADPVGWIRHVAVNRLRNGERNRRRRQEILASVRPVAAEDLTPDLVDLRAAIDALPERTRLVVCLYYLAALPVAEVATLLEISDGTVKSTLHDARTRLRAELREERHA